MGYIKPYVEFCNTVANNDPVFTNFRSHELYKVVLEHVPVEWGQAYLENIEQTNPDILKHLEGFKKNDTIGGPFVHNYGTRYGTIAPSTLRYIKVLADLVGLYKSLDGWSIFEIGGGYGGQCRIISELFKFGSYTIVDLPEVVGIPKRYLSELGVANFKCITLDEVKDGAYDLFISNYAFTELSAELQETYLDKVINKCKHGYITYNRSLSVPEIPLSFSDLIAKLPSELAVSREAPRMCDPDGTNYLLSW